MEKDLKKNVGKTDEFSNSRVPLSERKGWVGLLTISLGYVFVVTSMQVGGRIGLSLGMKESFLAVILSSVILSVLACAMAVVGMKSGLTFGLLSKCSFGQVGTWVPVAIVAITTVGWFSIDAYLIGQTTNALFNSVPIIPVAILGGIGMTITALRGVKWMETLSNLAVPLIFIFGIWSMYVAVRDSGGVAGIMAIASTQDISFAQAVSLGVGSYAVGAVMFTPDIMRFAKTVKASVYVMIVTMVLGNNFVVLLGAVGAVATGNPDISFILAAQGLLAPSFLVLLLNIWSTAQGCVYSGSLSLSSAINIKRTTAVIGFGVIGIIFAVIGFYDYFGTYINFLASLVPSLAGILFADYVFVYKDGYPELSETSLPAVNASGFIAWIAGFAVSNISIGFPVVNAIIVAFVVKALFGKFTKAKIANN